MEVGDLVTLWINKKKVGVIVSVHSWESINDFLRFNGQMVRDTDTEHKI